MPRTLAQWAVFFNDAAKFGQRGLLLSTQDIQELAKVFTPTLHRPTQAEEVAATRVHARADGTAERAVDELLAHLNEPGFSHALQAAAIKDKQGRQGMTGAEFRLLLKDSKLTAAGLAEALSLSHFDVVQYLEGAKVIPALVEYAILWIINVEQAEVFFAGN